MSTQLTTPEGAAPSNEGSRDAHSALAYQLFERHAASRPNVAAIRTANGVLTYSELQARVDDLVSRLLELELPVGSHVGVLLPRSADAVVAFLAVTKAGGAFVPLEQFPENRRYGLDVVVTSDDHHRHLQSAGARTVSIRSSPTTSRIFATGLLPSITWQAPASVLALPGSPSSAVVLTHGNLTSALLAAKSAFGIDKPLTVLSVTTFDDSLFLLEALLALSTGGSLILLESLLFASRRYPNDDENILFARPESLLELLRYAPFPHNVRRLVLVDGMAPAALVGTIAAEAPATLLFRSLSGQETAGWTAGGPLHIGAENSLPQQSLTHQLHVLDREKLEEVPVDAVGAVYASGATVGRPQSRNPDDCSFVVSRMSGETLVATGYTGCRTADGNVRLTGYHGGRVWRGGRYTYTGSVAQPIDAPREGAGMATAARNSVAAGAMNAYVSVSDAVTTVTERALLSIWQKVLDNDGILMDDNFFQMGANSLEAFLACSQIANDLEVELSIADVYNYPTTSELAVRIDLLRKQET